VLILDERRPRWTCRATTGAAGAAHILADRTALIIAHRLSTVEIATGSVMEAGRIVEDGAPEHLIGDAGRSPTCTSLGDSLV